MKASASRLAAVLLLAGGVALATTRDSANDYTATIDPPVGTIRCGFTVSGSVHTPKAGALAYGFFFRSELNIVTALDRRHPETDKYFAGPDTVRLTGSSKDFEADDVLLKHKSIQVQVRVWQFGQIPGPVGGGIAQIPALAESAWVDVPLTSTACASTRPATGLAPAPSGSSAPAPAAAKHPPTQQAPKPQ